jgi:hypothetical protein
LFKTRYRNENRCSSFNGETIEADKFAVNDKHKKAWIKTILYNSIFFPIADIISSLYALVLLYSGIKILNGDNFTTFGDLFSYTMFYVMLFLYAKLPINSMKCN